MNNSKAKNSKSISLTASQAQTRAINTHWQFTQTSTVYSGFSIFLWMPVFSHAIYRLRFMATKVI